MLVLGMPFDTSPEAAAVQLRVLKSMSNEQRFLITWRMSVLARELTKAGIREQHPEWSEREVIREVLRRAFYPKPLPAWVP